MQTTYDALIVGHGLAGAILAHRFLVAGQRIMVIDQDANPSASRIAAGIINPVTGHRLNITRGFSEFLPVAERTYEELAKLLGTSLYSRVEQLRLLKNPGQFDYFKKRSEQAEYDDIFGDYLKKPKPFATSTYGAIQIKKSGIVNTSKLLSLNKKRLLDQNAYRTAVIDYKKLEFSEHNIRYGDINAKRIIFCEGYKAIDNPWLKNLPFKLAKGEIVNLELENVEVPFLNWGSWLIPSPNPNTYRLGSTYNWQDLSKHSIQTKMLLESLSSFTGLTGRPISTDVGIRPTTLHRMPFVGPISDLPNSYCFNGFGSKGCLLIPSYANQLLNHILNSRPIDEDIRKWL